MEWLTNIKSTSIEFKKENCKSYKRGFYETLCGELQNASTCVGNTAVGLPVVPGSFDPFLNVFVSTDHILKDVIINLPELLSNLITNQLIPVEADIQISDFLAK